MTFPEVCSSVRPSKTGLHALLFSLSGTPTPATVSHTNNVCCSFYYLKVSFIPTLHEHTLVYTHAYMHALCTECT